MTDRQADGLLAISVVLIIGALLALGWYALFDVYPRVALAAIDVYARH